MQTEDDNAYASPGATFVRADLHVHTHGDGTPEPDPDFDSYIEAALEAGISVLAITDHNRVDFVRGAIKAAAGKNLLVLPGIEISTFDGHLLGLFDPVRVSDLEDFATKPNLRLQQLQTGEWRSDRSMLDLVHAIAEAGGLAIPAHVDLGKSAGQSLGAEEWKELLLSPALAGLEFGNVDALTTWFTDDDDDAARRAAWKARQADETLRARGLARLMSSDAHSPDKVGLDRKRRTMTRLRVDDLNFTAVRNAIVNSPRGRCKAEAVLPASYPRIKRAVFEGGFLDGTTVDFSDNLTCLIGGRGSGKSTALLAVRAALGGRIPTGDDIDDPDRMPAKTTITFVDRAGSERIAIRELGGQPRDPQGVPINLPISDLGQEETGQISRDYDNDPHALLGFLDGFVAAAEHETKESELLDRLAENSVAIQGSAGVAAQVTELSKTEAELGAALDAAKEGGVEDVAKLSIRLAAEPPFLEQVRGSLASLVALPTPEYPDLTALAKELGVDLASGDSKEFVDGDSGLRTALDALIRKTETVLASARAELKSAAEPVMDIARRWEAEHVALRDQIKQRTTELEEQGLKVQVGEVARLSALLKQTRTDLQEARQREETHRETLTNRTTLLSDLRANRNALWVRRKATIGRIVSAANADTGDYVISVKFEEAGVRNEWCAWLSAQFQFRQPRVGRIAAAISPSEFADALAADNPTAALLELKDPDGDGNAPLFDASALAGRSWTLATVHQLQTMRLPDRPEIEVRYPSTGVTRSFDHLSTGTQRSILLGLLLCADRTEPLIIDQPEDHLDGEYIASTVVRHLETAKERRQIIIATHNANLTVLGDAELVVPMSAGEPVPATGAVDRPETRERVCALLEGGDAAYRRRGERYGVEFVVRERRSSRNP